MRWANGWSQSERLSIVKKRTAAEIADLIERFLDDRSLYPQEWNDFVDRMHPEPKLDVYRKRTEGQSTHASCRKTISP